MGFHPLDPKTRRDGSTGAHRGLVCSRSGVRCVSADWLGIFAGSLRGGSRLSLVWQAARRLGAAAVTAYRATFRRADVCDKHMRRRCQLLSLVVPAPWHAPRTARSRRGATARWIAVGTRNGRGRRRAAFGGYAMSAAGGGRRQGWRAIRRGWRRGGRGAGGDGGEPVGHRRADDLVLMTRTRRR